MKKIVLLFSILFVSCIDLVTQTNLYNSLLFKGGSWMETNRLDSLKLGGGDFTLQFWASGGELSISEAPALFSIIDENNTIKLAFFRDAGNPEYGTTIVNSQVFSTQLTGVDWSKEAEFHLFTFSFSDTGGYRFSVNDSEFSTSTETSIDVSGSTLIIGALANESRTILENFWYGYIDEVRVWNTPLADSTIQFQVQHPNKFGDYYRYSYYDSLVALWRFNLEKPQAIIEDESDFNNHGTIFTKTEYSIELSKLGAN